MRLEFLYSFLIKRMMVVADEIFDTVKDSLTEYEKEIERLKQENCNALRTGVLQVPVGSELSEIQVKMEVATVMSHEPLAQAPFIISPLSEEVTRQETSQCLLPEVMLKNEDSGGTDPQSSITVKSEPCDNEAGESNSAAAQSGSDCHTELPVPERDPSSVLHDLETFEEVLRRQRQRQKCQNALSKIHSRSFRKTGHLQNHVSVHQNDRPFCCGLCGSRFKMKFNLNEHERIHKGDYRYSCPKCGRGFSRTNHVRNHLKAASCFRSSSSKK
ncbi:Zinc finger protein 282 [Labeo rohita]|uniref:Zinc finger protein 282 n=1 Tax=Labeo rohita TaxID=84645 RepID=A0ABQ8M9H9_LABRO|nr:Zinc finger protein 282 [Labeo rohita]